MPDVPPGHMSSVVWHSWGNSVQQVSNEEARKTNKRHLTSPGDILDVPGMLNAMPCQDRRNNTTTGHKSNVIFWPIYLGLVKSLNNFAVRTSFRFISKSNFRLFLKIFTRSLPGPKEFAFVRPEWPRYRKFHCLLVIWFKGQGAFLDQHKLGTTESQTICCGIWIFTNYLHSIRYNRDS